jgi:hypothetical protein
MSVKMEPVPGLTETIGDPCAELVPFCSDLTKIPRVSERKIILLSTAAITNENIYTNGLFQNVFVFYRMFEAMGYVSIMLVQEKPKDLESIPSILRACRHICTGDLFKTAISNIAAMIEIGMSIDPLVRQFVKMLGGKLFKAYLGNILNIDVETPIFVPHHHFAHHVVGRNDKIVVSPHYGQHAEYASYLNHVVPSAVSAGAADEDNLVPLIAPYVWDPNILSRDGTVQLRWRPAQTPEEEVFVIMEPNISFQKAALVPLMILEKWYRDVGRAAGWKGRVVITNTDMLRANPHFMENILGEMELQKDGRVELLGRRDIVSVLREWPAAMFLLHNYNNEFNYMTLELMWSGFPVLHNSSSWLQFGYSYEAACIGDAAATVEVMRRGHADRQEAYRGHAHVLAWRHSPYNPTIQAAWEKVLSEP